MKIDFAILYPACLDTYDEFFYTWWICDIFKE